MIDLRFAYPIALLVGLPTLVAGMILSWRRQSTQLSSRPRRLTLNALRGTALILIVLLIAQPVFVESQENQPPRQRVVVLVDRSESMGLVEGGQSRYARAQSFLRDQLLPGLKQSGLHATALLFAEDAEPADGAQLAKATPSGKRTNLGRALVRGLTASDQTPLAVIGLTDGVSNDDSDNRRAMTALVESGVPFVGIGFGTEQGPRTLNVQQAVAPPTAPRQQQFAIATTLEAGGSGDLPSFELILMRDGQLHQRREIAPGVAGRVWQESFDVTESEEGIHEYLVQAVLSPDAPVRLVNGSQHVTVRVTGDREVRVLYVQGALTWDYKFVRMALASDPAIKLTGLSRTSTASVFYQNVESTAELKQGFPTRLEDLAAFAVIVLSTIRPADLTPHQQEILARYCGEFGGGVLMIGGPETFDRTWRDSPLERLLAVRFGLLPGGSGGPPFQFTLTPAALEHPVFRISDSLEPREAWARVPPFDNYALVEEVKPGAEVWATHPQSLGVQGQPVLMASQRFGAGRSAVLCVQNFWKWRLARDSDPKQYDRFWQQLLRHLSEGSRDQIALRIPDQSLVPPTEVRILAERQPDPRKPDEVPAPSVIQITDQENRVLSRQQIELGPSRPVEITFSAPTTGSYTIVVQDLQGIPLASRTLELRDANLELQQATRDMERLRQWGALSNGFAAPVEDCGDVPDLLQRLVRQDADNRKRVSRHEPAGINGWVLTCLVVCLSGEWLLRKRWGLR